MEQATKLIKVLGLTGDAEIKKASEFDDYEVSIKGNTATVESFNYHSASIDNIEKDDTILVMYHSGGDENLWNEDGDEYDYDVDLDFFDDAAVRLFNAIIEGGNGLESGDATYGAGYNG